MENIIIILPTNETAPLSWAIVSATGILHTFTRQGSVSELAAAAHGKAAWVIAPAEDVLLTLTTLPKLNRQRLLQALPFALEEQLLTDINELHFAVGAYQTDGQLPVAIVAKQKMEPWLSLLKAADIQPLICIPAPLALPLHASQWSVLLHNDCAWVRTGYWTGFGCDRENVAMLLSMQYNEAGEKPTRINVFAEAIPAALTAIPTLATLLQLHTTPWADLLKQCETPALNLLQNDFQMKRQTLPGKKIWLTAALLAALWLVMLVISDTVSYFILQQAAHKTEIAINAIYKQNFPNAKTIIAPKQRMTEKLDTLSNQHHKNRLFVWLGMIGKSLATTNTLKIQQLDYRNNQLSLEITAPNFESIDHFTQALTDQQLLAKQHNVAASGNAVKGALIITEGNSA